MHPSTPHLHGTLAAPPGDLAIGLRPLASAAHPSGAATHSGAGHRAQADQVAVLGRLVELAADWVWEHDSQLHFTWCSRARAAESLPPPPDGPGPDLQPAAGDWDTYRALLDTRQPIRDFELLHHAADGTLRHLFLSGTPLFDSLGGWRGYTGVASDRSAERRAERLLRMEHGVTRGLADASTIAHGLVLALRALCEHEGWACGEYWVVDAAAQVLRFGGRWDCLPAATRALFEDAERFEFAPGVGLAGRVWQPRQPLWVAGHQK